MTDATGPEPLQSPIDLDLLHWLVDGDKLWSARVPTWVENLVHAVLNAPTITVGPGAVIELPPPGTYALVRVR